MTHTRSLIEEQQALLELLASPGWALFAAECEALLADWQRQVMATPVHQFATAQITGQTLGEIAAYQAVQARLTWPARRLEALHELLTGRPDGETDDEETRHG